MYKKIRSFLLLSLVIFFTFIACQEKTDIGLDLIPDKYLLDNSQDTITVIAYTRKSEPVISSGFYQGLVGSYIDPIFGTVKVSFVTQMRPVESFNPGKNPQIDSVVLYLKYDTIPFKKYGNENVSMQINVSEISTKLSSDSNYYNNLNPSTLGIKQPYLASTSFTPANIFKDSLIISGDTISNTLAVRLDASAFNHFFSDTVNTSTTIDWRDTTFSSYFKGLYISSNETPINGSISNFDLSSSNSKLTIYYRNSSDTIKHVQNFNFANLCANINMYEHQYNSPRLLADLNPESEKQDSVIYIQGSGLASEIKFPYLDQIKTQGKWIVNHAKLLLPVASPEITEESIYPAATNLTVKILNSDGKLAELEEYTYTDEYDRKYYFGVNYGDGKYIMDISYFVQLVLNGKIENKSLMLMVGNGGVNPARVILNNGKTDKIKLILSLTKI